MTNAAAASASPMPWLEKLGLHRPELRAWALYDVANSAWMTTVVMLFPLYLYGVVVNDRPADTARAQFAFVTAFSVVLVGLLGPLLGTVADLRASKKLFLAAFLALGASATAAMYVLTAGRVNLAFALFVVANVGVTSTLAFYNSLLPGIARPDEVDRVSTAGFALGYLGGGLLFALNSMMIANPSRFGLADANTAIRVSFLSVALWWILFALPLFLKVPEPAGGGGAQEAGGRPLLIVALHRLRETFRDLKRRPDAGLLLLAFVIYNDGVNTIIRMATTYGSEIGIAREHLIGALLMVQFVGVPFSFAFGLLSDRIGPKRAILLSLLGYGLISIYAYGLRTAAQFYQLAFFVGIVQGGAQGLSRSLFASLVPTHKAGEMFGFFGVFDRFGGAIGSVIFGTVLALTGSSRPAIVSLIVLFLVGGLILTKVDVERGRKAAEEENLQKGKGGA